MFKRPVVLKYHINCSLCNCLPLILFDYKDNSFLAVLCMIFSWTYFLHPSLLNQSSINVIGWSYFSLLIWTLQLVILVLILCKPPNKKLVFVVISVHLNTSSLKTSLNSPLMTGNSLLKSRNEDCIFVFLP